MKDYIVNKIIIHLEWNDGREYRGEWLNNNMHGEGIYKWPIGNKYEGEYKNNKVENNLYL